MTSCGGFLFIIVVNLLLCALVGKFAKQRGRDEMSWGMIAFVITPLLAGLLLFVLEDQSVGGTSPTSSSRSEGGRKKTCPFCAEQILFEATFCRFCHQSLPIKLTDGRARESEQMDATPVDSLEQKLLREAHDLYRNGEHSEALKRYQVIVVQFPKCREAWLCLKNSVGVEEVLRIEAAEKLERLKE